MPAQADLNLGTNVNGSLGGIPYIGENGFYPEWARGSGRWLFQRTLIVMGRLLGDIARIHALEVPASTQIIVWSPRPRLPVLNLLPSRIHQERQIALQELRRFTLVCYGEHCDSPKPGGSHTKGLNPGAVIDEIGLYPENWFLRCPSCGECVGPDLGLIDTTSLIARWNILRKPILEHPGAAKGIKSAQPIVDLNNWIQTTDPSPLELAYLGQQMWPDIGTLMDAMSAH